MDWISFGLGMLAGLFLIISGSVYGIIRANKRLGIDLTQLATQWYKSRRLIKESGITSNMERKDTGVLGEAAREERVSEDSGTGNSTNPEKSVSGTEEKTSN